jgi:N-acetylmuramoyl-L-alanine amidase
MGWTGSDWDRYVELDGWDHVVISRGPTWTRERFLARGYSAVPRERAFLVLYTALREVNRDDIKHFWRCLYGTYAHNQPADVSALLWALLEAAEFRQITVLERKKPRPRPAAPVERKQPTVVRSASAHYVVVEAVTDAEPAMPVPGLRLQLLVAGGEVISAQTDHEGFARVEGIHASRVVIRVQAIDGKLWRPLDGEPAQPSGSDEGLRWHEVRQGECLSHIAHRFGLDRWQTLWEHSKNEPLRKRRKSPHVLCPGDQVAVPGVEVYEIIRPTDATHRIAVKQRRLELKVRLGDHHGRPFRNQPYELHLILAAEEAPIRGTTSADGQVQAWLPADTGQVLIALPTLGISWPVALSTVPALPKSANAAIDADGMLDAHAVPALQRRLNALGIPSGQVDGVSGEKTQLALRHLRRARGIASKEPLCDQDLDALERFGV